MEFKVRKLIEEDVQKTEQLRNYIYEVIGCCQQVHQELGPFLNEYIYQDALDVLFEEKNITPKIREYAFQVSFHGRQLQHQHRVDFLVCNYIFVECKAVAQLAPEHRQQLWNYMRLTQMPIGILYNFAPIKDQCERYYYDKNAQTVYLF